MMTELSSEFFRTVAEAALVTMPAPGPQEGDGQHVLLAKQTALLRAMWALGERTGMVTDRAGNVLQVKHANKVVDAADTDEVLIAAPGAGFKIRVISLTVMAAGTATALTIGSKVGVAATAVLSGPWPNAANGGFNSGYHPHGIFDDAEENGALVATTGAGAATTLRIDYLVVPNGGFDWNDGDPIEWNDGGVME